MRRFVLIIGLLFCFFASFSQKVYFLTDTVHLDEVITVGELKKFQSGAKIERIDVSQMNATGSRNLEQLLSRVLPISFKSDAGGLSAIRIRGTAPVHTSLNFGSININSQTLGQSNMSNIPVFLFDEIDVQFGGSGSVNGSGSIGGAIHLGIKNDWTEGFKAEVNLQNGSFGEQLYGTKLFLGNGKFESVTRAYYYRKVNDFKFMNPYYRDFENRIFEIEDTQHNAGIENVGILQEFNYKFHENEVLLVKTWFENDKHEVQQNMSVNLNQPELKETYQDKNLRIWAEYRNLKNPFKYQLSGGFVSDNSVFNGNSNDSIKSKSFVGDAYIEHDFSGKASYKIGVIENRIYPEVYAYNESLTFENRLDFYASYFQRFFNKLTATVNLRQGFVTDYNVPFTPAIGLNYLALSKEKYVVNINGNIAKSYRIPTFNDRFWVPGGNPDLEPEKGMNYELGGKFSYCEENLSGNISVNAFYLNVDNWILWKNGGSFWYAENVQKVESKGVEIMIDLKFKILSMETSTGLNYSLTSAQRIESSISTNALNRQLEYVPENSGNLFFTGLHKKLDFTIDGSYTGKQFTDEEMNNMLQAYFLMNLTVGYRIKLNKLNIFRIAGMINNLLNTEYQSSWGYAMPGINYRISLIYNFK